MAVKQKLSRELGNRKYVLVQTFPNFFVLQPHFHQDILSDPFLITQHSHRSKGCKNFDFSVKLITYISMPDSNIVSEQISSQSQMGRVS